MEQDYQKKYLRKYLWLIDTINRAKRISYNELNEKWLETEMSGGADLSKRSLHNWINAIQETFQINIKNDRKGKYCYSIDNEEELRKDTTTSWLVDTFSVSNLLLDSRIIKDRIVLEHVPSGQEYLSDIIEAMKGNRVINITYNNYWKGEERTYDLDPFCVKLFRQRWYMVARNPYFEGNNIRIYSLDRIKGLSKTDKTFKLPKDWDAADFFAFNYGIIAGDGTKAETVKLKVNAGQANYLRDLPLHSSQEEERNDEYSIFSLYLCPTYDFEQELLSQGDNIEVLEPQWLREEMADKIRRMLNKYENEK